MSDDNLYVTRWNFKFHSKMSFGDTHLLRSQPGIAEARQTVRRRCADCEI